jgi:hypothetical protein
MRYNGTTPELLGPLVGSQKGIPESYQLPGIRAGKTRGYSPKVLLISGGKVNPQGPEKSGSGFLMAKNPVTPTDLRPSQTPENPSVDPTETTFFIKYEPELAEKLANSKNAGVSVSGRCLSIVFSRMLYWSRYAKHRFEKKLFFWKSQKELAEETGFSEKQINRALKSLVDLGLLIREKFHKRFWRQVYFYHVPVSPFTKEIEIDRMPRPRAQATGATSSRPISPHPHPIPERASRAASEVRGAAAAGPGGLSHALEAPGPAVRSGAADRLKPPGQGFSIRTKAPHQRQENSNQKRQTSRNTLLSIIQRCEFYGTAENYERMFGKIA